MKAGGQTLYFRRYPTNGFASQTVGYSTQGRSRAGLEREENAYLTASNANLGTIFDKLERQAEGHDDHGATTSSSTCTSARSASPRPRCAGKCGAAVVLNPKTGAVYVMASSPSYDPNQIESPNGYARILHSPSACPGSTSALLEPRDAGPLPAGLDVQDRHRRRRARLREVHSRTRASTTPATASSTASRSRTPATRRAPEPFGNVDFLQAFEHSINAVFCNIGKTLGARSVLDQAKKFGFYSKPPIELPVERGRAERARTTSRTASSAVRRPRHRSIRAASRSGRSSCS